MTKKKFITLLSIFISVGMLFGYGIRVTDLIYERKDNAAAKEKCIRDSLVAIQVNIGNKLAAVNTTMATLSTKVDNLETTVGNLGTTLNNQSVKLDILILRTEPK